MAAWFMNSPPEKAGGRPMPSQPRRPRKRLSMASLMAYAPRAPSRPSIFNIVRTALYCAVLVFSVICLGISAHFFSLLQSSDLTRFVPFAIFVCCITIAIFVALLGFSLRKQMNPISVRIELGCLAFTGILWLSLGAFMATSESQSAEVECFSDEADTEPIDLPSFSTETYHAQYRVLEAFSLFNVALILAFLLFLTALGVRHHLNGSRQVWYCPVPSYGWFVKTKKAGKLPAPAVSRSQSRSRAAPAPARTPAPAPTPRSAPVSRPAPRPYQEPARQDSGRSRSTDRTYRTANSTFKSYRTAESSLRPGAPPVSMPQRTYPSSRSAPVVPIYDKYRRDASPRRQEPRDKYRRDASPRR